MVVPARHNDVLLAGCELTRGERELGDACRARLSVSGEVEDFESRIGRDGD